MNWRNPVLAFAAASAILASARVGWTADNDGTPPQTSTETCVLGSDCCCQCARDLNFYGDFLYLRPRNAGLEYAVPMAGPISAGAVPLQVGRTAALNPEFEPGFRIGGGIGFGNCSTLSASFTHYENSCSDAITTDAPHVIRAMVMHPSSLDAAADWLDASAHQFIRFNLVDVDFRHVFYEDACSSVDYLAGIRYANLTQTFNSQFESVIRDNVDTNVNFDGAGIRLGLEGQRSGAHDIFVYGKASASFLGGEFQGNYLQTSINNPVVAQTDWKEARLVTMLDCEVGLGWTGCNGHVLASAGYMVNGWLNVVKQSEFISSVQANNYHGPDKIDGNGLVFDGFVAHLEFRR